MEPNHERPVDWDLLTRYVSGECSERQEVTVETWAAADPKNRKLLKQIRSVWRKVGQRKDALPIDVDAALDELNQRINEENATEELENDRPTRKSSRSLRSRNSTGGLWTKAAPVVVIFAIAFSYLAYENFLGAGQTKKIYTTQPGRRAVVQLNDGTKVHLNAGSRLVLPNGSFAESQRKVRLEGEGYFDVTRDTTRPFRVKTQNTSVQVLGTAFNIEAYSTAETVRVAVEEGKVAIRLEKEANQDTLVLKSRQLGIASRSHLHRKKAEISNELAWTKGELVFRDSPFEEVIRRLERWYGLRIKSQVPTDEVDRLNANLNGESLDQTLKAVATALDLQHRREGSRVVFYHE